MVSCCELYSQQDCKYRYDFPLSYIKRKHSLRCVEGGGGSERTKGNTDCMGSVPLLQLSQRPLWCCHLLLLRTWASPRDLVCRVDVLEAVDLLQL